MVKFFFDHHSDENIQKAIGKEQVILLHDHDVVVGAGTARKNEIARMSVLPQFKKSGYGTLLMNELEDIIKKDHSEAIVYSSLPAYDLYIKRRYAPVKYEKIITPNKDVLCFHVLKNLLTT